MGSDMSKYMTVKYFPEREYAKEPYPISLDLRWAIPSGFYGKVFPPSGILKEHFVAIDAEVIDSDFRGIIQFLLVNHLHEKTFTVRAEDRIAQAVFM